jgi:predicted RNase H-like nuclease
MPFSSDKPYYIGADGCRAGWFAILIGEDRQWHVEVFRNILELWVKYQKAIDREMQIKDIWIKLGNPRILPEIQMDGPGWRGWRYDRVWS